VDDRSSLDIRYLKGLNAFLFADCLDIRGNLVIVKLTNLFNFILIMLFKRILNAQILDVKISWILPDGAGLLHASEVIRYLTRVALINDVAIDHHC
jgi:hypothetical protein